MIHSVAEQAQHMWSISSTGKNVEILFLLAYCGACMCELSNLAQTNCMISFQNTQTKHLIFVLCSKAADFSGLKLMNPIPIQKEKETRILNIKQG